MTSYEPQRATNTLVAGIFLTLYEYYESTLMFHNQFQSMLHSAMRFCVCRRVCVRVSECGHVFTEAVPFSVAGYSTAVPIILLMMLELIRVLCVSDLLK